MKKYLYGALALPLLFACSSEDFEKEVVSNDQFAGIEKVDATFSMAEGTTRMAKDWELEEGDQYGFAWMGGGQANGLVINGEAWQNHPLTQTSGIFKPQTSIYVGNYYIYRPYDYSTVNIGKINFNSLAEQTLKEGKGGQAWAGLANNAIVIGDKWTNVTTDGTWDNVAKKTWNKAGISEHYKIFAAVFSNQTGLDLTYVNNNKNFDGQVISGATDIYYKYPSGSTIGAADITKVEVTLTGAAKSFTYGPKAEPNAGDHSGNFWETQKNLNTTLGANAGFNFADDKITLNAPAGGISTATADNKAWFWFNSLPVTAGDATSATNVTTKLYTSYGNVTVTEALADCAYAYEDTKQGQAKHEIGGDNWNPEWIKLAAATDETKSPKEWNPTAKNTFINQYGNHKGKYVLTVDFKNSDMSVMHIENDAHLQKALKFYIASGKTENVVLNLDKDADGEFKISKISLALIKTIGGGKVKVKACATGGHTPAKIVVTQAGQAEIPSLADKKEVPALMQTFAALTDVYLSKDYEWTWAGGDDGKTALAIDGNVTSIINEGKLTVNATNLELSAGGSTLENAAGATMNITKVTTVKTDLTNLGTIIVGSETDPNPELRAYNATIINDAEGLEEGDYVGNYGVIVNYGVVGSTANTTGEVHNYGYIKMMNDGAITLLKSNQTGTADFNSPFSVAADNKMGVVELPENNPRALVSVNNQAETGFIKYTLPKGTTTYRTPTGNVKYNTIMVSEDITFDAAASEVQYIEFMGNRTQVVNPQGANYLNNLKGIYVHKGNSIIIEKNNKLVCGVGAYLAPGATVYLGGVFTYVGTNNYIGTWSTDQIIEY
jgi:hypothetical protein